MAAAALQELIFRTLTPQSKPFLRLNPPAIWDEKLDLITSPLHYTAENGWPKLSSFVLDRRLSTVNEISGYYGTALNAAVYHGHESIVRFLLDAGADPYLGDQSYPCALTAAMRGTSEQCARILLELPTAIEQCEKLGFYPLITAMKNG